MTALSVEEAATRLGCIHFQRAQTLGTIWKNRCSTDAQKIRWARMVRADMLAIEVAYTALTGKPFVRSYKADQVLEMEAPVRRMYSARTHKEKARMASDRPREYQTRHHDHLTCGTFDGAGSDVFCGGSERKHASDMCGSL
jgi:hypothetical protein